MKVNLTTNKISFGYNRRYHENLWNTLKKTKHDKQSALDLIELDRLSLSIEDKIIQTEQNMHKGPTDDYYNQTCMLIALKNYIADIFKDIFPNFHYGECIAEQYEHEAKDISWFLPSASLWRSNIADCIRHDNGGLFPKTDNSTTQSQDSTSSSSKVVPDSASQDGFDGDIITLYTKTQSSPDGFSDIVGMDDLKAKFKDEIIDYVENPTLAQEDYLEYGIRQPRGYLLYGPPGCGKTYIVQALASESGLPMYKMDISKIGSKYINETSNNIEKAFKFLKAQSLKNSSPVLLFMDEVDSIAIDRTETNNSNKENSKATTTLLKNIDTARDNGIIVIAATNIYDTLDDAFKSRFDSKTFVGFPDVNQIEDLLVKLFSKRQKGAKLASSNEEISILANKMKGFSNRTITFIIEEASKIAKRDSRSDINFAHVDEAIRKFNKDKIDSKQYDVRTIRPVGFTQ